MTLKILDPTQVLEDWIKSQHDYGREVMEDPFNNVGRVCSLSNSSTADFLRTIIDNRLMDITVGTTERYWLVVGYAGNDHYPWCPKDCTKSHHQYVLVNLTGTSGIPVVAPLDELTNLY